MSETLQPQESARTERFTQQRQEIIDAAVGLINIHGVAGFTLGETARLVGLTNNSIKYYFRRKDDLLFCCFSQSLDRMEGLVKQARNEEGYVQRVRRYIDIGFSRMSQIASGAERRFLRIQDLRALEEPLRGRLMERYRSIFRQIQDLFGDSDESDHGAAAVHTHVMLEALYGLASWLGTYAPADHARVREQFMSLLMRGLAPSATWNPTPLAFEDSCRDPSQREFLNAATKLINQLGYRGASVEKISAALKVTKGSFYHHLEKKDDLVLGCFDRTFELVESIQAAASALPGDGLSKLMSAVAALVQTQLQGTQPFLKSSTVLALPATLQGYVTERLDRIARRFSGMIVDGMCDGSIPPTDPIVAAYVLRSLLNAAYELSVIAPKEETANIVRLCACSYFHGIFAAADDC